MAKMRVVQVTYPNGPLHLVEREIPEPTRRTLLSRSCAVAKKRFRRQTRS